MARVTLDLCCLGERPGLPALSIAKGQSYAEAAAICLEDRSHIQGVVLDVKGSHTRQYCLRWPPVTQQLKDTYNDLQDATCDGAYGVAIVVARDITGLTVLQQSRKGTGFDYWLG